MYFSIFFEKALVSELLIVLEMARFRAFVLIYVGADSLSYMRQYDMTLLLCRIDVAAVPLSACSKTSEEVDHSTQRLHAAPAVVLPVLRRPGVLICASQGWW